MKSIFKIAAILILGLVGFAVHRYWLGPLIHSVTTANSTPDCIYGVPVGDSGVARMRFSPDGKLLAIVGQHRDVIVEAATGKLVCNFSNGKDGTSKFVFSRDSKMIGYCGSDKKAKFKSVDGNDIAEVDLDGLVSNTATDIDFVPKVKGFAVASAKGVLIYTLAGKRVTLLEPWNADGSVPENQVSFNKTVVSPDSNVIYGGQWDGTIWRWPTQDFAKFNNVKAHPKRLTQLHISPDGNVLVTSGGDQEMKFWDAQTLELIRTIETSGRVTDVSFDANGATVLTSESNGAVAAWNRATGEQLKSWSFKKKINTVALSPDQSLVGIGLGKSVSLVNTSVREQMIKNQGYAAYQKRYKSGNHLTIKGETHTPGVALVLTSRIGEADDKASPAPNETNVED